MHHFTLSTIFRCAVIFAITTLLLIGAAQAQTSSFTYQGRLNDTGTPANASYDFQFKLFDAVAGGNQIGSTNSQTNVTVTNGVFSVSLDFGSAAFPGAARFLEISLRLAGGGAFTTLTPRRPLNSVPYAVAARTLSTDCVTCITDAQIAALAGSKVTGTIPVAGIPTGSGNYIQNTTSPQSSSNFNISGTGTAGTLRSNGQTITSYLTIDTAATNNGVMSNLTGNGLRFGGADFSSGESIASKRTAGGNQFGLDFYTAYTNRMAIAANGNVGIGTTSPANKLDVSGSIRATSEISSGFALGASNSSDEGGNLALTNPLKNTGSKMMTWRIFNMTGVYGDALRFWRYDLNGVSVGPTFNLLDNGNASFSGNVGLGVDILSDRLHVIGDIRIGTSGGNGCLKAFNATVLTGTCSSDLRFKRDVTPFSNSLHKVTQLQPVHFYWRAAEFPKKHFGKEQSYGLIAQEVEVVLPELVSEDEQGYKQINYSKLPLLTIQAIKELKAENDTLKEQNAALKKETAAIEARLAALEKLLQPPAAVKK